MSFLHLSQSSNSERRQTSSFNSAFNFNFDLGRFSQPSKVNSDVAGGWGDSWNKNNSLLFNQSSKGVFPDEATPVNPDTEYTRILNALNQANFGEADPKESVVPRDLTGSVVKPRSPKESVLSFKDGGFRPVNYTSALNSLTLPGLDLPLVVPSAQRSAAVAEKPSFQFLKAMENMDAFPIVVAQAEPLEAQVDSSVSQKHSNTCPFDLVNIKLKTRVYKSDLIKPLEPFLMKLFTQTSISAADYVLSPRQDQILQAILGRKFHKRIPSDRMSAPLSMKAEVVSNVINTSFTKRPEECYKYFTIRILKFARDSIRPADLDSPVTDEEMYEKYFGEVARKNGMPLRDFYYPLNKQAPKGAKLNSKYFDKLKMSPAFMAVVREYLAGEVHREHIQEVSQKLFSLLKPHDQFIRKRKKTEDACFADLMAYIESNKHCKFPWTMKELKESQEKFEAMIFGRASDDLARSF